MLLFCLIIKIVVQEVAQSGTTPNEAEVTSLNTPSPLVWTCQKKKKKNCGTCTVYIEAACGSTISTANPIPNLMGLVDYRISQVNDKCFLKVLASNLCVSFSRIIPSQL